MKPKLAMIYARQMLSGLAFMHKNQVIHRDLKPGNVLISTDGKVKLADFGAAYDLSKLTHTEKQTICGTPAFIAPEVVQKGKHTTKTDIWSLGVTVYNMLTGDIPFTADDRYQLLIEIVKGELNVEYPEGFCFQARVFIDACLAHDPYHRPSAECLLAYQFIKNPQESNSVPSLITHSSTAGTGSCPTEGSPTPVTVTRMAIPKLVSLADQTSSLELQRSGKLYKESGASAASGEQWKW